MKQVYIILTVLVVGIVTGYLLNMVSSPDSHEQSSEKKPLYWVAPMDPNFRRDEPGLSPMGMELVPVYAEDSAGGRAGVVRISPEFQHNIGVKTGRVIRGNLSDTLRTVAKVEFDENQIATVYPRVDGWLEKLYVKAVGDEVQTGQPLFDIYSPTLVNAQEEYVAVLGSGNQQLIASSRGRLAALGIPKREIDALKQSRKVQQSVTITSRHAGVVRKLGVREGNRVNPGTQIMEIAGLDPVWVTAEIFESDIGEVELGNQMDLQFVFTPGVIKRASIDFIYPMIESLTRTLEIRATLPNPDRLLRPSMFADASIKLRSEGESLLVPVSAIIRTGRSNRVVLALNEQEFKSVEVKLGRLGEEFAEVTEGLVEGDLVVTSAQFLIDSESSVSSDFRRLQIASAEMVGHEMNHEGMDHGQMDPGQMDHGQMDAREMPMNSEADDGGVWATGVIRAVDTSAGTVSLSHDPIPEWNWPTMVMTMNVSAAEAATVKKGARYRFRLRESSDAPTGYLVSDFMSQDGEPEQD